MDERSEHQEAVHEILAAYREQLGTVWPTMLVLFGAAVVGGLAWNRVIVRRSRARELPWPSERWLELALVLVLIGFGLKLVIARAACFDDAFISLRYVDNFVAGKGLVFNEGERVEGYTNFLWVMLISLFAATTPLEPPLIAVGLCIVVYVINLLVVWRICRTIAPAWHPRAFRFPLAVGLLAVQNTFVDYGTSGLETGFASLLVNLGVLSLLGSVSSTGAEGVEPRPRSMLAAGLCWILATLTRPDHAIFYAVGSAVVFGLWIGPSVRALRSERSLRAVWRAGLAPMLAYAAPFSLWLAHAAWKLHYYGELMPNTYYAKSAGLTYYAQGWVYATEFHFGSHLWIAIGMGVLALPLLLLGRRREQAVGHRTGDPGPTRRFLAFALPAILLYEWYVIRIGGDFMAGRFYVSVLPLLLMSLELCVHELGRLGPLRSRRASNALTEPPPRRQQLRPLALIAAGLLACTAMGVRMIKPRAPRWHLADESTHYPIAGWSPIVIEHGNYGIGQELGAMQRQGIEPIIATGTIGMVGYYSRMTVIDRYGLTDATVAHSKVPRVRGRPGHEKRARTSYLRKRGVHFTRGGSYPKFFEKHGKIRFGKTRGREFWILRYDRELMREIRAAAPDARFEDFEVYLDRHYLPKLPELDPEEARHQYSFFRRYYFDHNEDSRRQRAFDVYFAWVDAGKDPKLLISSGRWRTWLPKPKTKAKKAGRPKAKSKKPEGVDSSAPRN